MLIEIHDGCWVEAWAVRQVQSLGVNVIVFHGRDAQDSKREQFVYDSVAEARTMASLIVGQVNEARKPQPCMAQGDEKA